jgi:hypothetical protein
MIRLIQGALTLGALFYVLEFWGIHKPLPGPLAKASDLHAICTHRPLEATRLGLNDGDCRLVSILARGGVRVAVSTSCDNGIEGLYHPGYNVLILCEGVTHTGGIGDTLRHEATHAAQDCKDGLNNHTLEVIDPRWNPFLVSGLRHDRLKEQITNNYHDPEVHALEYEAFSLAQSLHSDNVSSLVSHYCH